MQSFLFLLLLGQNDTSSEESRIVGGYQANIEDISYQAALVTNWNSVFCGGSIISEKWIVTAAHCVPGRHPMNMRVRVGSSTFASGGQLLEVVRIIAHPNYNPRTIDFDIAVIEVSPMTLDNTVGIVRLPNVGEAPSQGTVVLASGWGHEQSGGVSPSHVRAVSLQISARFFCRLRYPNLTRNMICAQTAGRDTCQNDSGGPLVVTTSRTLVGITSFGRGCATPGYPGVYVNVANANMRHFISTHTGL